MNHLKSKYAPAGGRGCKHAACFPAFMHYDSIVEEFSFRPTLKGANALTPHRLFRFTRNCKRAAFTTTYSPGMKARNQVFSLLCLNPQSYFTKTGRGDCAQGSKRGLDRLEGNFEFTEGVVH
jgi:hypothetical protein